MKSQKKTQLALLSVLIASIAGQWERVKSWVEGLPDRVQFFVGTLVVLGLSLIAGWALAPILAKLFFI